MLAMRNLFCSCLYKVRSQISDALSQALCHFSLAFLADLILSDSTAFIRFIAFSRKLHSAFVWIERHDHSVHMSSILQAQQLYTAGIPLLEAYLLPMANNRTRHNERLSAASHVSRFIRMRIFRGVKKWPTYHVAYAVGTGNALASLRSIFSENRIKFSTFIRRRG